MFVYMCVTAATGRQPNCSKKINNNNNNKHADANSHLMAWLHWRMNRHNTTAWTDSRQGSKNQPLIVHDSYYTEPRCDGGSCLPAAVYCLVQQNWANSLARHLLQLAYGPSVGVNGQNIFGTTCYGCSALLGGGPKKQKVPQQRFQAHNAGMK